MSALAGPRAASPRAATEAALIEELARRAREFGARGWTPATSGNYSLRLPDGTLAITRSGVDKARLEPGDFLRGPVGGPLAGSGRPSAEAVLHEQIYRCFPAAGAVLHVHSPAATIASRRAEHRGCIELSGYELLKAFPGITTHEASIRLAVVPNSQHMASLAASVEPQLALPQAPPVYLIAGHGIYAWGEDVAAAARHLEAAEFLLDCHLQELRGRS